MERCPAEGKGWDGKPAKDFHLPTSWCSPCITYRNFFGTLYKHCTILCSQKVGQWQRGSLSLSPGECVCAECSAEGTPCPSLAWSVAIQALSWPCLCPAPALAVLCPVFLLKRCNFSFTRGRREDHDIVISVCGSHLSNGPWVLVSISVSYPRPV